MPYDEARYISRDTLSRSIAGTQTYTASAVVLTQTVAVIPFPDAGWPVDAAVAVDVVGVGSSYTVALQNGSTVIATGSVQNTANVASGLTITTASSVVAANSALNILVIGTGTASAAQVNPVMSIQVGIRKQFV